MSAIIMPIMRSHMSAIHVVRKLSLFLVYSLVVVDALFLSRQADIVTFFLLGGYGLVQLLGRFTSKATFIFCLFLLLLTYICFVALGPTVRTEKLAVWLYLFIAVGIFQKWRE